MDGRNNLYIIGKSVDCSNMIDEADKANKKAIHYIYSVGTFTSLLLMFGGVVLELLDGKKLHSIEGPSMWQILLALSILALCFYLASARLKKVQTVLEKYRQFCSTEALFMDEEKIYGTTATGSIQLKYEQISDVLITPTTDDVNNGTIGNDLLEIRDIVGNVFAFYSFSNCKEIKNIVDMQINKGR